MSLKRKTFQRKVGIKKRLPGNGEERSFHKQDEDKFGDILNKKWKVFRVSPLYNFSRDKLKFYQKLLNEEMNSKEDLIFCNGYKSTFTLSKNLRLNDESAEAIQVEVSNDDMQTKYVGNFISWSNRKPEGKDSVSLPILLVRGKPREINAVHSSLSKMFDCDIQPVMFPFHAMIVFLVKLLETPRNYTEHEHIFLEYRVPECSVKDKIKVSLDLNPTIIVFAKVMESLQETHEGITPMEIIREFYSRILNHIYNNFKFNLLFAELQKVSFPDAFLTSDGQLMMSTANAALVTLNILEYFTPLQATVNFE